MCSQEAAVSQTSCLKRSSFFFLSVPSFGIDSKDLMSGLYLAHSSTKHRPQLFPCGSEPTPDNINHVYHLFQVLYLHAVYLLCSQITEIEHFDPIIL